MLTPQDSYNEQLVQAVHPPDWKNPTPASRYDLVVIGAGTAGLVTAAGAAGLGAKVALVERHFMGGDCLNYGCVPSKALISAARTAAQVRDSDKYGVEIEGNVHVDFAAVMERMRRMRAEISRHDSVERFTGLGIDVFLGSAAFHEDGQSVMVEGARLTYKKAVICTGARAAGLPIHGLEESGYLTNETLFSLTELPKTLAIIGAGPIGCEMAQAFARFGSKVILFERGDRVLSRDDPQAAEIVSKALQQDGVELRFSTEISSVEIQEGKKRIRSQANGVGHEDLVEEILVATGRTPNVEGLNLEAVGVEVDGRFVKVDDRLQTANRRIYAAGDICFPYQFTHTADFLARAVIQNALFFGRSKASSLLIPWSTYTSPEVAHVGLPYSEIQKQRNDLQSFTQPLADVDRAFLDGEEEGFVKVHVKKGTDKIVAATIVASHAGDLISEVAVAMKNGIGLKGIGSTIHPYPTQAEAIRKLGDQYNKTRLTPLTKSFLSTLIRWNW